MIITAISGSPGTHRLGGGAVVVRAPWLTQGYVGDGEKSEEVWSNGWLHTGDIGFIDGEGYLPITDRIKDVIKTGGKQSGGDRRSRRAMG